ncbi:MAG: hypothetical protein VW709_15445 [Rickettsiales bacterium]|jgi:hypothetical protein
MKRSTRALIKFPICGLLVVLSGCAQNEPLRPTQSSQTPAGRIEMFRPVADVPIPKDAELNQERSLILSGREDWTGRLVMVTSISSTEAYSFFRSEMPRFDWSPVMTVQSAISVLTFTRAGRAATVQVERRALGGSLITVTVAHAQESVGFPNAAVQPAPLRSQERGN